MTVNRIQAHEIATDAISNLTNSTVKTSLETRYQWFHLNRRFPVTADDFLNFSPDAFCSLFFFLLHDIVELKPETDFETHILEIVRNLIIDYGTRNILQFDRNAFTVLILKERADADKNSIRLVIQEIENCLPLLVPTRP